MKLSLFSIFYYRESEYLNAHTIRKEKISHRFPCTSTSRSGFFLDRTRVPVAHFFAAGHGEFAASVPGGHTDIFKAKNEKEKIFLVFLLFFCPYSLLIYTLFKMSFPIFFFFFFNSSQIVEPYKKKETSLKHPGTLKFRRAR